MSAATGGASTAAEKPALLIGEDEPNYGSGGNITRNGLEANQTLISETIGPYTLSYITNTKGTKRMVRKITEKTNIRRGQFEATVREADVYNELIKIPDHTDHILPYVRSKRTNDWVYIDWAVVEGIDFERYVATLTDPTGEERKRLLLEAIGHLQWLLDAGYSHGDVKLSNFFIDTTGKTYIIDFGTSRRVYGTGGIRIDQFSLMKMASVLYPGLTEEKKDAILIAAKRIAEMEAATGISSPVDTGKRIYENIAKRLVETPLIGGRAQTRRRKRRGRRTHRSIPRIIR